MSYIYKSITAALLVLLSAGSFSCGDNFLASEPFDLITEEEFLGTPEAAQQVLNSAYGTLASGAFMGGQTWMIAELMADNINGDPNVLTNGDWRAHYTRTTDIFLGTTRSFLADGARTYGRGHYLLERLDIVAGLSEAERKRMTAEIRFLRAVAMFEIVRVFAQPHGFTADNSHQGIPIHLRYSTDPVDPSTVAQVYDQILSDLQAAAADLPESNGNYATSWAAKGYLAKVYFQMNDFQNAYNAANEVISSGRFPFDPVLENRFSLQGTTEAVFQLASTNTTGNAGGSIVAHAGGTLAGQYRLNPNTNTAQAFLSNDAFSDLTASSSDLRGQKWVIVAADGLYACNKFETSTARTDVWNVPLLHITELKLIRAESAAELNANLDVAVQDLRDIQNRAEVSQTPLGASAANIVTEARRQRRIELIAEGNRFHELKRIATATVRSKTMVPVSNLRIRGALWDCNGMVCQWPDSELSANPNMRPNPSGGCN
jgi:starch-binding outer membrane protein, SusD/RagB family